MPVVRANCCLARVMPNARLSEKLKPGIRVFVIIGSFYSVGPIYLLIEISTRYITLLTWYYPMSSICYSLCKVKLAACRLHTFCNIICKTIILRIKPRCNIATRLPQPTRHVAHTTSLSIWLQCVATPHLEAVAQVRRLRSSNRTWLQASRWYNCPTAHYAQCNSCLRGIANCQGP